MLSVENRSVSMDTRMVQGLVGDASRDWRDARPWLRGPQHGGPRV